MNSTKPSSRSTPERMGVSATTSRSSTPYNIRGSVANHLAQESTSERKRATRIRGSSATPAPERTHPSSEPERTSQGNVSDTTVVALDGESHLESRLVEHGSHTNSISPAPNPNRVRRGKRRRPVKMSSSDSGIENIEPQSDNTHNHEPAQSDQATHTYQLHQLLDRGIPRAVAKVLYQQQVDHWTSQCFAQLSSGQAKGVTQFLRANPDCPIPRRTLARYLKVLETNQRVIAYSGRPRTLDGHLEATVYERVMQAASSGRPITNEFISSVARDVAGTRLPGEPDDSAARVRVRRCGGKDWVRSWKGRYLVRMNEPTTAEAADRSDVCDSDVSQASVSLACIPVPETLSDGATACESLAELLECFAPAQPIEFDLPSIATAPSDVECLFDDYYLSCLPCFQ